MVIGIQIISIESNLTEAFANSNESILNDLIFIINILTKSLLKKKKF